jgi:hypothetical protein
MFRVLLTIIAAVIMALISVTVLRRIDGNKLGQKTAPSIAEEAEWRGHEPLL